MAIAIVACDRENGIGLRGSIPWKSDLDFFKRMTVGHVVIMGRKTWESLPKPPLPDRMNIVVSTHLPNGRWSMYKEKPEPFYVCTTLEEAMTLAGDKAKDKEHFIIGGEKLYASAFEKGVVDSVLMTRYGLIAGCDTFFPKTMTELEKMYPKWKTVEINNDVEIPYMRNYYA